MQPSLLLDVGRDARQYTGRMAADTLWAVAQLQQHSPQLAHKLVMQLRDFMSHLDPADLALAIWALASMQHSSLLLPIPELLKQVSNCTSGCSAGCEDVPTYTCPARFICASFMNTGGPAPYSSNWVESSLYAKVSLSWQAMR